MKVVVGLGNPGKEYEKSRHNLGFILLDKFAKENNLKFKFEKKFNAEIAKTKDFILAKPLTYMNESGESVLKIINYFNLDLSDLLVVHDDFDLEFGEVKKQKGRGAAGHKGVQNVIDTLKTNNFKRIRVGIGKPSGIIEHDEWVLMEMHEEELSEVLALEVDLI